jgi:hypothetical protein
MSAAVIQVLQMEGVKAAAIAAFWARGCRW